MNIDKQNLEAYAQIQLNYVSFLLDLLDSNKNFVLSLLNSLVSSDNSSNTILNDLLEELKSILIRLNNSEVFLENYKEKLYNLSNQEVDSVTLYLLISDFVEKQKEIHQDELTLLSFASRALDYAKLPTLSNHTESQEASPGEILIISELKNKVILPYSNKEIPLSRYKNFSLARFRESFKLMKKENSSILKALNLSIELMFRYDLHPAVISACKNIDELDIYISCLDNNKLDEFPFFEIKFEIPPYTRRTKHTFD